MIVFSTPASTTDLLALAAVKAELRLTGSDEDTVLARMIASASTAIGTACGRDRGSGFGLATAVETFQAGSTRPRLWLGHWPVQSLASVEEDYTVLDSSCYEIEGGRKLNRLDGASDRPARQDWPPARVVVTYTGGYALPEDCPPDLAGVALAMVKSAWFARQRDPMVKSVDVPGVISTDYWVGAPASGGSSALPAELLADLQPYRNFAFG